MSEIIAVSVKELKQFGCPYCGCSIGSTWVSGMGAFIWECADCEGQCIGLSEGSVISPFGIGSKDGPAIHPKLQKHPRYGIPSHEIDNKGS